MNHYGYEIQEVAGGFRPCLRLCGDSKPNPIKMKGGEAKVFQSRDDALEEVLRHIFAFINGREIRGERFQVESDDSKADALFPGLKPTVKQRGKERRIPVEVRA